ncbi:MAG: formylglycine-generating enzyme family protein, partial [Planctomycetes bacterium]|nr:formylglycine-generating enzyme family protein [Planctomycetota bacterium]
AAERQGRDDLAAAWRAERAVLTPGAVSATLALVTEPAGATVTSRRITLGPRWSAEAARSLGATPLEAQTIEPGHYLLEIRAPGRVTVTLPLRLLDGTPKELHIELPRAEGIPAGFTYLAPGPFLAGGDLEAVRPLARGREEVWVPGVFIANREVTGADYAKFLNGLTKVQRDLHRPQLGNLVLQDLGRPDRADHPVVGIRFESARAYCSWLSKESGGVSYRLPSDLEWEKAARPFPELAFPWGTHFDPGAPNPVAWLHQSGPTPRPRTAPGGSRPGDRSLYGIFDLGGNAAEWVEGEFGGDRRFHVLRGGSWLSGPELVRSSSRTPVSDGQFPDAATRIGFRVAFD